jgi:hypothetical protein
MKKVLLSLSLMAAFVSANAQTNYPVGIGAYDDMSTQGVPATDPTGEFSKQIVESGTVYTTGIFWWQDAANPNDYVRTRAGGVLSIATNKATDYSPVGCGFGDTKGDGTGIPFTIDISAAKTISFDAMASTGSPTLFFQVSDINGVNGEIVPQSEGFVGNNAKLGTTGNGTTPAGLSSTMTTFTFDLTGILGQAAPSPAGNMWVCANYPTDCPDYTKATAVDYTKISKISFFISGGTAYTGTVTLDNLKIGASSYTGVDTTTSTAGTTAAVAANISSTVIYPNPAANTNVSALISLQNASQVTTIVTDLTGRQVATNDLGTVPATAAGSNAPSYTLFNSAGYAKGMYTVTYVINGTSAKTDLVVVQ